MTDRNPSIMIAASPDPDPVTDLARTSGQSPGEGAATSNEATPAYDGGDIEDGKTYRVAREHLETFIEKSLERGVAKGVIKVVPGSDPPAYYHVDNPPPGVSRPVLYLPEVSFLEWEHVVRGLPKGDSPAWLDMQERLGDLFEQWAEDHGIEVSIDEDPEAT